MSRPSRWAAVLLLVGALPYLIVVAVSRKRITAPYWPLCSACIQRRHSLLSGGAGALAASLVLFLLGSMLQTHTTTGGRGYTSTAPATAGLGSLLLLLSIPTFVAGIVIASMASTAVLAGGVVTHDGMYVEFRNAAFPFVRWATEFLNAGQPVGLASPPYCPASPPDGLASPPEGQMQSATNEQVRGPGWPVA